MENYISEINKIKANLLYDFIDSSDFCQNNIHKYNRSFMNVVFKLRDVRLNDIFT
ncbi:hypothetical protein ONB71_02190 [Candidatus Purcelliella pentastirinorum]|uniref:Uncharacterized protein n=1 Tax=Candidatus Purcelliella pentastirinorum TaxID=472834 RepID=A0AAX3N7B7_9ENTR|nr:hypothetical protein [Candidatus Purcelliella pentastirinorum]WDI78492.1 hypothetical protein ONB71_02190 [Candidatus Purcelliella pentastirinorum]